MSARRLAQAASGRSWFSRNRWLLLRRSSQILVLALFLTGFLSARAGDAPVARAIVRNVIGGVLAMGITFAIGTLVGTQIG